MIQGIEKLVRTSFYFIFFNIFVVHILYHLNLLMSTNYDTIDMKFQLIPT